MAAILNFRYINVSTMVLMDSLHLITYEKMLLIYVPTTNINFSRFGGGYFDFFLISGLTVENAAGKTYFYF